MVRFSTEARSCGAMAVLVAALLAGLVGAQAQPPPESSAPAPAELRAPSVSECKRILQSDLIRNMDDRVAQIGIRYEPIFDAPLRAAGCTRNELPAHFKANPKFTFEYSRSFSDMDTDSFRYYPYYTLAYRHLFIGVLLIYSKDGLFVRSNWGITAV